MMTLSSLAVLLLWIALIYGDDNIRITEVATWIQHGRAFCNITCSDGITGMGQMGRYYKYKNDVYVTQKVFIDEVVQNLLNYSCTTEPFNVMNNVIINSYKNTGQFLTRALSGVSMAIYEIYAIRANQTVGNYLGGDTSLPIPIYGSSVTRSKTVEEIGKEFQSLIKDWGIQQFKFKIAQRMGNNTDVWWNRTEEVIVTIREMVGANITLMVDANGGYTEWRYIENVVKLLEEYNYHWLEEPVPWWDYKTVRNISAEMNKLNYAINIALGEQEYRRNVWNDMINDKYVNVIQPDAFYGGGFETFLDIAQWSLDQQNDIKSMVIPHSPSVTDFTVVYTMHFMSLKHGPFPNIGPWMEFGCDDGIPTKDSDFYFTPKLKINRDGTVEINDAVGWGYTLRSGNYTDYHHYHA